MLAMSTLEKCPLDQPLAYEHPNTYYTNASGQRIPCEFVYNCHYSQRVQEMLKSLLRERGTPGDIINILLKTITEDPICILALDMILNIIGTSTIQYFDIDIAASDIIGILVRTFGYPLQNAIDEVIHNPSIIYRVSQEIVNTVFSGYPDVFDYMATIDFLLRRYFYDLALKSKYREDIANGILTAPVPYHQFSPKQKFYRGGPIPARPSGRINPITVHYRKTQYQTPEPRYIGEPSGNTKLDDFLDTPGYELDNACKTNENFKYFCNNPEYLELYIQRHGIESSRNASSNILEKYMLRKEGVSLNKLYTLARRWGISPRQNSNVYLLDSRIISE